jgi:basic amino acid/polyamine antiporter, APA family
MARVAAGEIGARFVGILIVLSTLGFIAVVIMTGPRLCYAMAADGLFFARAARLHPRYHTPTFALWFQTAVSLALLMSNTYDELLSYVVFADWLFFGLTAASLFILRRRDPAPPGVVRTPGHPVTTGVFVAVAAGVFLNSFFAYTKQSLIGSAILIGATVIYFTMLARGARPSDHTESLPS